MRAFFDERQRGHDPQFRLEDGKIVPNPDNPKRVDALLGGAKAAGCTFEASTDHGMAPLAAVHTPRYLRYLRTIHQARSAEVEGLGEVIPGRTNPGSGGHYSYVTEAQIGFHNADTSCPISDKTWDAIYWSTQTALSGADAILASEPTAYALSRPSGHHAFSEVSGGFCFVNNSAVAAEYLRAKGGHRPVILDIDVHHGNGTQDIFYHRADVFTVSLHVDTAQFYPFYLGGVQEVGTAGGHGYNLNVAVEYGADTKAYLKHLNFALEHIQSFCPSVIVVALGLDTHKDDPFKGMSVSTEGFTEIAKAIAKLGLPTLCVQEGGYMQPALGNNLTAFLSGL